MNKKIVHLTTVHGAYDPRIYYRECMGLAKRGYQVTLLAPGDKNLTRDAIHIISLGHPKNRLDRFLRYQLKAFMKVLRQKNAIIHFHDPELIFSGLMFKLLGKKVVYDVHEDVPEDILLKGHIPKFLRIILANAAKLSEKIAGQCFDSIIAVTPAIAKKFPDNKVKLVRNYPEVNASDFSFEDYAGRKHELIYVGSMNEQRGLKEMIQAVDQLNKTKKVSLTLAGNMSQKLNEQYIRPNPAVHYLSWLPFPQISQVLNQHKIGLVILHPTKTFLTSYPLKLFEYMAAGLPVIASNFPDWEAIIKKYDCGITVDPLNPKMIAESIHDLLDNPHKAYRMGQNGRKAILAEFNWENESKVLLEAYDVIFSRLDKKAST
ncbi:glycosyltransferase family 4 protein [Legionella londiniensis]|uniref:Glycosyl transferase, group 1 n=1 Tax=Legionella londiniensis TaxID=45068 RepID=A0A0W0VN91_9GAMM|nr:glycosyltransferase family 4 protein [Legionella londiniensis]KTD21643.1 glycosyl transferase, group 1 [Legionella londiniensis]STX93523.1 glycosyl transferase, group 1 [Legionella londiniensis]